MFAVNQTYRSKGRGDLYLGEDALVIETGDACIAINRRTRQQVRLNPSAHRLMVAIGHNPGSGTARELALRMPRFVSGARTAGILAHDELPGGRVCVLRTSVHRVFVELTSACNLKCQHCYGSFGPSGREAVALEVLERLIAQASEIGVYRFDLTGGEPMMHPEFDRVLEVLGEKSMLFSIFSNLTHVASSTLSVLQRYPAASVITSLESHRAEVHDAYRGQRGSYARTLANIEALQAIGVPIKVNLVVGRHNYGEIERTIAWLRSLAVTVVVDTVHVEGRADSTLQISPGEARSLQGLLSKSGAGGAPSERCGVAAEMVYVDSSGVVRLCPSLRQHEYTLGDARQVDFDLAAAVSEMRARFAAFHQPRCSVTCSARTMCDGGCQARSINLNGAPWRPDPEMCSRHLLLTVQENRA